MECLNCEHLLYDFAQATTRHFKAVDHLSNLVDSNSRRDHEDHKRSFIEAHVRAWYEFERCQRARDAFWRHRSEHRSQAKAVELK